MRQFFLLIVALLLLSACSHLRGYTPAYQQGNVIDQKRLALLKPGMSKEEVAYVIGTPIVDNLFAQDRWDYVYTYQPSTGHVLEKQKASVFFRDGGFDRYVIGQKT